MDELEQYLAEHYWSEDDLLREVRADIEQRGPQIQVSAEAGRLLALLVRAAGATRVLEVGTLFGYSGIWMARELPAGRASRHDRDRADARRRGASTGSSAQASASASRCIAARALEVLATLPGPYDVAFIDADKAGYPEYARHVARAHAARRHRDRRQRHPPRAHRARRASTPTWTAFASCTTCSAATPNLVATTVPVGDGLAIAVKRS